MGFSERDLRELGSLAAGAAREAGELIEQRVGSRFLVEGKEAGESLASQVVTEVDRLAEERILRALEASIEAFGLGVLTEERKDDGSRFEREAFWCIDPLDGTLPFVEGVAGYAVSIALVSRAGAPLVGVVYDPREDRLFEATKGCGARVDGQVRRLPERPLGAEVLAVFSDRSSRDDPRHAAVLSDLEAVSGAGGVSNTVGMGAALNACSVLRGGKSCYFKLPKVERGGGSVWDFAASACILSEAGGVVCDLSGAALKLNPERSLFMNESGVLFASCEFLAERIRKTHSKIA